jgi:hypothetical protein
MNGSEPMLGKINEMTWDEMGRCVMLVRIACAIFPFFRTVGIGISGRRIAFYFAFLRALHVDALHFLGRYLDGEVEAFIR